MEEQTGFNGFTPSEYKETGQTYKGTATGLEAPDEAKDIQGWDRIL